MVAQHPNGVLPQITHQARFLVIPQRHAVMVVVADVAQHKNRLLRDRQHTRRIVPHGMHSAVNGEAGRVDRKRRIVPLVAVDVDLDQTGRGNLVKHQAVAADQKFVFSTRHPGTDVGEHQVIPLEQHHQAVSGGQVQPGLPCFSRRLLPARRDVEWRAALGMSLLIRCAYGQQDWHGGAVVAPGTRHEHPGSYSGRATQH